MELPIRQKPTQGVGNDKLATIEVVVAYDDAYVQPLILSALSSVFPKDLLNLVKELPQKKAPLSWTDFASSPDSNILSMTAYEDIDFDFASSHKRSYLINSYMIRKALIRKHYLTTTVDHWVAKNPDSILKTHVKRSEAFEVDYAEFLDDSLVEAFDLRESMDRNAEAQEPSDREWWILKPGMSDRGQGIKLFSTMDELQKIFDTWEAERPDSDDEDEEETEPTDATDNKEADYITTSHLRHFVAQPYIHPPLLVEGDNRKFHIRTYVLCYGSLKVYVYKHMLALFAAKPYAAPHESADDIETYLTNTCLQSSPNENTVQRYWDLNLPITQLESIFEQICNVTGEIFEGAARALPIHFQTLPNAFEVFGLDFMVDAGGDAWLLEVNAFPDFKQTGGDLKQIVQGFWEGVMRRAVAPFYKVEGTLQKQGEVDDMTLVTDVDLGRR